MKQISQAQRAAVRDRSGDRCEALDDTGRCARRGAEVHHRLSKGRGGRSLDRVDETIHLAHLCRPHHRAATDGADFNVTIGWWEQILGVHAPGQAIYENALGRPLYVGPDELLTERYGPDAAVPA